MFDRSARSRYGNSSQGDQARPGGIRPDDGIPEEQGRAKEADVLQVVPAARAQGQVVERRDVPEPGDGDEKAKRGQRMSQPAEEAAHRRRREESPDPENANGCRQPPSKGNSGAPSQSSGGATIMSSRCCTMWTCKKQGGERLDRRRQGQENCCQARRESGEAAAVPRAVFPFSRPDQEGAE